MESRSAVNAHNYHYHQQQQQQKRRKEQPERMPFSDERKTDDKNQTPRQSQCDAPHFSAGCTSGKRTSERNKQPSSQGDNNNDGKSISRGSVQGGKGGSKNFLSGKKGASSNRSTSKYRVCGVVFSVWMQICLLALSVLTRVGPRRVSLTTAVLVDGRLTFGAFPITFCLQPPMRNLT